MEFKRYKLGTIAKTSSGATPTSTKKIYYEGGTIPWINSGELSNPFIDKANNYITKLGFDNSSTKMYAPNETVLLAMYGATAGKAALLQIEACTNQAICAIIPDQSIVDPLFLKYKLDTMYNYLVGLSSGSARDNLSQTGISNLTIDIPSLAIQKRISKVLYSLDRKKALNRAINQNLEALAKQLYDYWFVQFDFPNENGQPYKSSGGVMGWSDELRREIPAGWNVVQLGSLIESNRGISYNTSTISGGGVPMLNLASFNVDGTYKHKGLKSYNGEYSADKVLKPFDLVMCNTQQTAIDEAKDIIGKAFLVPNIFNGDIVSSHHVTTLKCESILKPYLAYLSNTRHFHKYATGCCSGTNIMGLDFSGIERYRMELPPKPLIQRFYDIAIAVEEEKCKAILENERLIMLRDELLPLLMNGQVSLNSDLYDSMYIIIYDMDLYFGIYEGKHHYGGGHGNAA